MKIIFNADDFGLTRSINEGIIKAHQEGVVGSTTIMMNGMDVDYAIMQAKKNLSLKVGVHLVLTWGEPVLSDVNNLIDESGHFKFKSVYQEDLQPNLEDLRREWTAQIEAFLKTGLPLNHLDSHHHVHGWPFLKALVIELAEKYQVPVRAVDTLKDRPDLLYTAALSTDFYAEGVRPDFLNKIDPTQYESLEIMTHPAYVDEDLKRVSSYVDKRKEELEILRQVKLPQGFELA